MSHTQAEWEALVAASVLSVARRGFCIGTPERYSRYVDAFNARAQAGAIYSVIELPERIAS